MVNVFGGHRLNAVYGVMRKAEDNPAYKHFDIDLKYARNEVPWIEEKIILHQRDFNEDTLRFGMALAAQLPKTMIVFREPDCERSICMLSENSIELTFKKDEQEKYRKLTDVSCRDLFSENENSLQETVIRNLIRYKQEYTV